MSWFTRWSKSPSTVIAEPKNEMDIAAKLLLFTKLDQRRALASQSPRIDNAELYAGSDMYYYCRVCSTQHFTVNELYAGTIPGLCADCDQLQSFGMISPFWNPPDPREKAAPKEKQPSGRKAAVADMKARRSPQR